MRSHALAFTLFAFGLGTFGGCAGVESIPPAVSHPYRFVQGRTEAPFGDHVSTEIRNYTRVAPYVATAGRLSKLGPAEAKSLGFELLVDLRQPHEEGVHEEQALARELGIEYVNVPLQADHRAWQQVDELAEMLTDTSRYPVLIHCGSSNRAGALWALYRHRAGVGAIAAIEEGRAAGLKSRESMVRSLMGLPSEPRDEGSQ